MYKCPECGSLYVSFSTMFDGKRAPEIVCMDCGFDGSLEEFKSASDQPDHSFALKSANPDR